MYQFRLPDIGEGVVEAELTQWRVKAGQTVHENEVLAELLTDKATIEIPSPRAGVVAKLGCKEGEVVKVGAVLIEIEEAGKDGGDGGRLTPAPVAAAVAGTTPDRVKLSHSTGGSLPRPRAHAMPMGERLAGLDSPGRGSVGAVPAVREYARSQGVDLAAVPGTGPSGRIMRRDVDDWLAHRGAAVVAPAAPAGSQASAGRDNVAGALTGSTEEGTPAAPVGDPPDWKRVPLRGVRRTIAERMVRSKFTAPHYTYMEEMDVTELEIRRLAWQAQTGVELSPLVLIARAVVRVLPDFPEMNAMLDEARGEVVLKGLIHLGIATAVEEGLLVPVVRDAGEKSTRDLAEAIRHLAQQARQGALGPGDLKGSTFTISSLGKLGGIGATPILNYPEVAILATNQIRVLPRYVPGAGAEAAMALKPRQIMNVSMSLDHRVVDGLMCARFVAAIKKILESADFPDLFEAMPVAPDARRKSGKQANQREG